MPVNNDSYVPLQRLYNSSNRTLQIIVRPGNPNFASRDSDVPIRNSRLVRLSPGRTLSIEPNRIDMAQLSRFDMPIQISRLISIGVKPSKTGTTYPFNGAFYLECSSPIGLPIDNEERSMFGWVKPVKAPNGQQGLFGYGDTNLPDSHNMMVYNNEGERDIKFLGSSTYNRSRSQNVLIPDRWNFVGMTRKGRILTTYVNGLAWSTPERTLHTSDELIRVGFSTAGEDQLFIGDIKSLSIWDNAKDREYANKLRESGPVEFNDLPSELLYASNITDCVTSKTIYKTVGLDVRTPPGTATVLEASVNKEYVLSNIKTTQFDYTNNNMTTHNANTVSAMSKDYELDMLRTHLNDTISGSNGSVFYSRSNIMTETTLEFNSRSALPFQDIEVYSDGALGSLSSRTVSSMSVFSLSARVKDTTESSTLMTSDNQVLKFISSVSYNPPISYWNLSEIGDTNTDSVANNDLIKIAV